MLIVKHIQNNTVYIMQELHLQLFSFSARVAIAGFSSSTVSVHSSIYLSSFFCIYNFHNLKTHQYHMIYHIHTHNY